MNFIHKITYWNSTIPGLIICYRFANKQTNKKHIKASSHLNLWILNKYCYTWKNLKNSEHSFIISYKNQRVGYHLLIVLTKCTREIDNQTPLMTDIYIKFTKLFLIINVHSKIIHKYVLLLIRIAVTYHTEKRYALSPFMYYSEILEYHQLP